MFSIPLFSSSTYLEELASYDTGIGYSYVFSNKSEILF